MERKIGLLGTVSLLFFLFSFQIPSFILPTIISNAFPIQELGV